MAPTIIESRDAAKERRLDDLRRVAEQSGLVQAPGVRLPGAPFPAAGQLPGATPQTGYYGLPVLKEPTWIWSIPVYFFAGGAAGGGAVIAAIARWSGDRTLARDARILAVLGAVASPPLLIVDLGRPERFLAMLRVFKRRSPMSVGVWTLVLFSMANTAALAAELVSDGKGTGDGSGHGPSALRRLAGLPREPAAVVAALSGLIMCTYTGVLVGVTAIPVWAENVRLLPAHFGTSGVASAVALLELRGHTSEPMRRLGIATTAVETIVGGVIEGRQHRGLEPLKRGRSGWLTRIGGVLSGPVPLALRLFGRRSPAALRAAAVCTIAGSIITRFAWIDAGKESARDPVVPMKLQRAVAGG
jgi:hypothetical protein